MLLQSMTLKELIEYMKNKRVFCFGSGIQGQRMAMFFENWNIPETLFAYIDNDSNKVGKMVEYNKFKYPILSFEHACDTITESDFVLVSSLYYKDIYNQIEKNEISRKWNYLSIDEVAETQLMISDYAGIVKESEIQLIPKTIHYVWLGNEMPKKIKENIECWRSICPDYKFYEWNDQNYDITSNRYMKQAYENKHWSFVSDYMRLDIIYKYGGIYLDTDIEIVKKPDELLYQRCFASVDASLVMNLGSGFGATPACEIIKVLRDYYDDVQFIKDDGSIDKTSCNTHSYNVLKKYGAKVNDELQNVNGMNIYPMVFQGANQYTQKKRITDKTFWIHYGNMSWM